MTIEQRIEALEKRCKRLSKTFVGVGTLTLFAVVAGTAEVRRWAYTGAISPSSITTETIHLTSAFPIWIMRLCRTESLAALPRVGRDSVLASRLARSFFAGARRRSKPARRMSGTLRRTPSAQA